MEKNGMILYYVQDEKKKIELEVIGMSGHKTFNCE